MFRACVRRAVSLSLRGLVRAKRTTGRPAYGPTTLQPYFKLLALVIRPSASRAKEKPADQSQRAISLVLRWFSKDWPRQQPGTPTLTNLIFVCQPIRCSELATAARIYTLHLSKRRGPDLVHTSPLDHVSPKNMPSASMTSMSDSSSGLMPVEIPFDPKWAARAPLARLPAAPGA